MADWCKENAKMGITWNAKGGSAKDYAGASSAGGAPSAGGGSTSAGGATPAAGSSGSVSAPAAASPVVPSSGGGTAAPNINALFSAISSIDQSSGRTEGLRKVTKDMCVSLFIRRASAKETSLTPAAPRFESSAQEIGECKQGAAAPSHSRPDARALGWWRRFRRVFRQDGCATNCC
jgi:hypothetical protein